MAITNQERVGKAMDLLRAGLAPVVDREVKEGIRTGKVNIETIRRFAEDPLLAEKPIAKWDVSPLLKLMWDTWNDVFGRILGRAERSLVQELRDWRNKWAHQEPFSSDDTDRALDSITRLLAALSAPQADDVAKMKMELRRLTFEEQVRREKRKAGGSLIESSSTLKPWREIITPHPDVASGRYEHAEFAADLWQVHIGQGTEEYRNPVEFFRRTYLTGSLRRLLVGAVQRLSGKGGDPVVQLQTNFGGGKTHSMLALYHLFGGTKPSELFGVDEVMAEAGVTEIPTARRVVLVGNKISPGNPVTKPDGTVVRTLWGELAWQLGGKEAYARVARDDENATNPGDVLRELFRDYGPCLILIDEWVAYARQLHDDSDLPGGSFETQFTFAQALTESAKLAGNCLLVISLPASDTHGSPHTHADDVEVGGIRGREALDRLRNVIGRVESSWRPATAEEGFEIVRRRLFEPLRGPEAFKQRDVTARAFADLYRAQKAEFPSECSEADYERRIQAAYPIHPEVFDRLYADWSTLVKFQRTRGVLRLMAAVIHCLWENGDKNPLILPSTIPIDDSRVQFELTRYLSDNWTPIIEKDVDGAHSLPARIDREVPNLGRLHATRRVARTIYLGSAPLTATTHRGLDDHRIKLGCVMPGEPPALFSDALRRLASQATYLYQDGTRAWYSTQPTVSKLARDRAEQLRRDPDKVAGELERRIRDNVRNMGDFSRVHALPQSSADVPDDLEARLVVLPATHPHSKGTGSAAQQLAQEVLENRGTSPRLYRNTLVFLAADSARMQDLEETLCRYLAWKSIVEEAAALNLDPAQQNQAKTQLQAADSAVTAQLPETYQWLLVPEQQTAQGPVEWHALKLTGSDPLAMRASRKLRSEELLLANLGATILRMRMDTVPLWRSDHVPVRQLVEDFARYLYLPRIAGPEILIQAIRDGVAYMTWQADTFAYAEGFDEANSRYRGLQAGRHVTLDRDSPGLLVKPEIANRQFDAEAAGQKEDGNTPQPNKPVVARDKGDTTTPPPPPRPSPRRFHGTVELAPTRVGRDAGRIAEEVISHLAGLPGAQVKVTLEIDVHMPDGATEHVIRTVTENCRALKFDPHSGFENE